MKTWVLISGGHGPPELAWVVHRLGPALAAAAAAAGLACRELSRAPGPAPETAWSLVYELEDMSDGAALAGLLAAWEGTAQWIGRSPLRPTHRRRNWFVKVTRLPVAAAAATELREADLEESAVRSSGSGGQNVNKRSTAVRLRHRPSGLEVVAREERSQAMNRKIARERLAALLLAQATERRGAAERARWDEHNAIERGNARQVFRGPEFARVAAGP
jgi:peptide chain release factor